MVSTKGVAHCSFRLCDRTELLEMHSPKSVVGGYEVGGGRGQPRKRQRRVCRPAPRRAIHDALNQQLQPLTP